MKFGAALFLLFVGGVPLVFVIAMAIGSLVACGGIGCLMNETTYHQVAFPVAILVMFIGGLGLGSAACWVALNID